MDKAIISNIYEIAKEKYGKKSFTFQQLWKELVKRLKLDKQEQSQVGHVYSSMLQDHRFIFAGNNEWKLREFLTLKEQAELCNALYDFQQEESDEKQRLAGLSEQTDYDAIFYDEEEEELMAMQDIGKLDDEDIDDEEKEQESEIEDIEDDEDA